MKRTHLVSLLVVVLVLGVGCSKKADDAKVTAEIQSKFSQDSTLGAKQLSVEADNGVVTLSGSVDNDAQRQTAGQQAATVNGVKTVINNLQVATAAPPSDAMMAAAPSQDPSQQPAPTDAMTSAAPAPAPAEKPSPGPSKKSSKPSKPHSAGSQNSGSDSSNQMASNTAPPATAAPAPVR